MCYFQYDRLYREDREDRWNKYSLIITYVRACINPSSTDPCEEMKTASAGWILPSQSTTRKMSEYELFFLTHELPKSCARCYADSKSSVRQNAVHLVEALQKRRRRWKRSQDVQLSALQNFVAGERSTWDAWYPLCAVNRS